VVFVDVVVLAQGRSYVEAKKDASQTASLLGALDDSKDISSFQNWKTMVAVTS